MIAADGPTGARGQAPAVVFSSNPSVTMQANQITPVAIVIRSRFFSAIEDPERFEETPPPNMLDRPPPLPR